jgi:nitroreductase
MMDFYQTVAARRSVRSFLPTPIPDDAVARVLAAAQLSPSPRNSQPWRFVVFTGPARERLCAHVAGSTRLLEDLFPLLGPEHIAQAAAFLSDLGGAPLVVVITYPAQQNEYDHKTVLLAVGGAALSLQLAFAAEGLGSVCVTSAVWVEDRIRDDLGLGGEQLATIIPVGYLKGELGPRPPRRDAVLHCEEWLG